MYMKKGKEGEGEGRGKERGKKTTRERSEKRRKEKKNRILFVSSVSRRAVLFCSFF
jgi:hypothetical protein